MSDSRIAMEELMLSLFDQEVLHQKILETLLGRTQLARRLGIWNEDRIPRVHHEPERGCFDIGLSVDDGERSVLIELKAEAHLTEKQFEAQGKLVAASGGKASRAYILLGPAFFCWKGRLKEAHLVLVGAKALCLSLEAVLEERGQGPDRELASGYLAVLRRYQDSHPVDGAYRSLKDWVESDFMRFYSEMLNAWGVPGKIYPVTHRGGQDLIMNATDEWLELKGTDFTGQIFWEVVNGKVRFKIHYVGPKDRRKRVRERCRQSFEEAARQFGFEVRRIGRVGVDMTIIELKEDSRDEVLREGRMIEELARGLLSRCRNLHREAAGRLGVLEAAVT